MFGQLPKERPCFARTAGLKRGAHDLLPCLKFLILGAPTPQPKPQSRAGQARLA